MDAPVVKAPTDSRAHENPDAIAKILNRLPSLVGYWDKEQLNRFCNEAYSKYLGVSPEQALGRPLREILGEKLYQLNLPYIEAVLRGEGQTFERILPNRDGSGVRYSLAEYIPDVVDGEVRGFIVQVSDVTRIKEAELALEETNRRLSALENLHRTILQDQSELISRLTGEGVYVYANEVFLRFFGKTEAQIIGSKWYPLIYPDDLERVSRELSMLSPDNPLVMIENRLYSGTGQFYWMEFSNRGIFDANGRLAEIQSVGRDITRRKQLEATLTESEERFRILAESSMVGIYVLQDGKYVYVNPTMAGIFGHSVDDMIGMTPDRIVHPGELDRIRERIRQKISGEVRTTHFEVRGLHKDGTTRDIEVFGSRMDINGKPSLVGTLIDITERKRAEKAWRESLEQSVQAIADTIEARDPYTAGHQRRVAALSTAIGRHMGLAEERIRGISLASTVHDLGKIQVPAEILSMPRKLTPVEFALIQEHSEAGYNILKDIRFPWPIAEIVHQHHEKMDGSGYPRGLSGDQILLEARILSVADTVEAMLSHRPYRAALGVDAAVAELQHGRGSIYDAAVVDACIEVVRAGALQFDPVSGG